MRPSQIQQISQLITEDPDIFCEMGGAMGGSISQPKAAAGPAGPVPPPTPGAPGTEEIADPAEQKPLNATEIEKQADDQVGTDPAASGQVADQMQMQQEMEKQQAMQKEKVLMPQIQQLEQAMQKLNTGVLQGKQAAATGGEQFGTLDKEMTNINSLIGNLQKQI